jgi:hypothetical protein
MVDRFYKAGLQKFVEIGFYSSDIIGVHSVASLMGKGDARVEFDLVLSNVFRNAM